MSRKQYLGDAVWVEWDDYYLTLTTEEQGPEHPTNRIMLEPEVLVAFARFVKELAVLAADEGTT